MLYKKIHRQYLREFWVGREFKYKFSSSYSVVCKVTKKLYTSRDNYIHIDCVEKNDEGNERCKRTLSLMSIASHPVCRFLYKYEITLLD